jgi:general secretion pathway protein G
LCLAAGALALLVFGPLVARLLSPATPEREKVELADAFLSLHATIWFGLAGFLILVGFSLLVQSHRVAGPLVRFSHIFDALRHGDVSVRVRLREKDYLQDEARSLDCAVRALRRRISVLQRRACRSEQALDELKTAIAAGRRERVDAALVRVVQETTGIKAHLDAFITTAGFTLIELLQTLAIVGTIAAISIPAYGKALDVARVTRAIAEVRAMGQSLKADEIRNGVLPDSLAQAGLGDLHDPYGHPYVYYRIAGGKGKGGVRKDRLLNPINSDFDLYSMGKDGQSKTQLTNKQSLDDIVRANDGGFVGLAADF